MTGINTMHVRTNAEIRQMFLDGTPNEHTKDGRLRTVRNSDGNIELRGYHTQVLAEYNEATRTVRVNEGHLGTSKTVTRWIKALVDAVENHPTRRLLRDEEAAPFVGRIFPTADKIDRYVLWGRGPESYVEQKARAEVTRELRDGFRRYPAPEQ